MSKLALSFLLVLLPAVRAADFYVAPGGNDTNPGTKEQPFATIERARDEIRKLKPAGATVFLRGGTYRITKPVVFTPEDSGAKGSPIIYRACPGEKPVIGGGRRITGLQRAGKLWTTTIPEVRAGKWYFNQLFVNGQRRQRARIPNSGYLRMAGPAPSLRDANGKEIGPNKSAFHFKPGDLRPWSRLEDANLVLMHSWETSIHHIKSVCTASNLLELAAPMKEWWTIGYWEREARYYVENIAEGLDAPGEWYFDRQTGVLSCYPMPGERMDKAEIVAPVVGEFVRFEGKPDEGRFVDGIRFVGLTFQHADWTLAPQGNSSTQAAVEVPAVITADGARDCAVEDCTVAHIGTYGVWFRRGCKDCVITRCHIYDLGAGGIRLGEPAMAKNDVAETSRTLVDNNYLHDYGNVYAGAGGVWVAHSSDNRISHNEIHSGNYTGISLGWNWNDCPTRTLRNTVEFNHIHHIGRGVMSDMGGIYTLGRQTGAVLRGNLIHDVFAYDRPALAWGIYHDAGSNGFLDEGNVCYHTTSGGIMNTGLFGNHIRNNIFAAGARQLIWRYKFEKEPATVFERNICLVTQGDLFNRDAGQSDFQSKWDHNLFWRADRQPPTFYGMTFAEWQAKGVDRHSIVADPLFVNAAACDFQLKPNSPAITELGFQPIDVSQCGLYARRPDTPVWPNVVADGQTRVSVLRPDREWVGLPKRAKFPKTVLPAPPPLLKPTPIADGFEKTPLGERPQAAQVSGEDMGASIRVSDERAASGKRSLKFTDVAGMKHIWEPHLYYQPHFNQGVVHARFKLWLGQGAIVGHEWRDSASPYTVGPSLQVDASSRLITRTQVLMTLPREQWITFELRCTIGEKASGAYSLSVTIPGQKPREFPALPCDPKFRALEWFGFTSMANAAAAFYLDDLDLRLSSRQPRGTQWLHSSHEISSQPAHHLLHRVRVPRCQC